MIGRKAVEVLIHAHRDTRSRCPRARDGMALRRRHLLEKSETHRAVNPVASL